MNLEKRNRSLIYTLNISFDIKRRVTIFQTYLRHEDVFNRQLLEGYVNGLDVFLKSVERNNTMEFICSAIISLECDNAINIAQCQYRILECDANEYSVGCILIPRVIYTRIDIEDTLSALLFFSRTSERLWRRTFCA